MSRVSTPRLPKGPRAKKSSPPLPPRPPEVTEADLQALRAASSLREKIQLAYRRPCSHCGALPTIPRLAAQIGVDATVLWRFLQGKQVTLMEGNFKKIQEWVEREVPST